jgi:pimeloyl-ACP methyl ester carboxylesterase
VKYVRVVADWSVVYRSDYWSEWRRIRCSTLVVRGEQGNFDAAHAAELASALGAGQFATIPHAGHDVHLNAPTQLADQMRHFLS